MTTLSPSVVGSSREIGAPVQIEMQDIESQVHGPISQRSRYFKELDPVDFFSHLRSGGLDRRLPISEENDDLLSKRKFLPQGGWRRTGALLFCGSCVGGALYGSAAATSYVGHTVLNFIAAGSLACGAEGLSHLINKLDSDNSNITQDATHKIRKLYAHNSCTLLTVVVFARRTLEASDLARFERSLSGLSDDVRTNYEVIERQFLKLFPGNRDVGTFTKPLRDTIAYSESRIRDFLEHDQDLLNTFRLASMPGADTLTRSEESLFKYLLE